MLALERRPGCRLDCRAVRRARPRSALVSALPLVGFADGGYRADVRVTRASLRARALRRLSSQRRGTRPRLHGGRPSRRQRVVSRRRQWKGAGRAIRGRRRTRRATLARSRRRVGHRRHGLSCRRAGESLRERGRADRQPRMKGNSVSADARSCRLRAPAKVRRCSRSRLPPVVDRLRTCQLATLHGQRSPLCLQQGDSALELSRRLGSRELIHEFEELIHKRANGRQRIRQRVHTARLDEQSGELCRPRLPHRVEYTAVRAHAEPLSTQPRGLWLVLER